MLLKRYSNIDFVLGLEWESGLDLIEKAIEEEGKKQAWELYLTKYAYMTEKDFMSFEDFYNQSSIEQIEQIEDNRTADEIVNEAEGILRNMREGR